MISVRVRNSVEKRSVFAADRCSVGKIQVPGSGPKRTVLAADRCSVAKNGAKRAQTQSKSCESMPGGEVGNRFRCRPVLRRHDSAPKFRSPFRVRKASFSLQTGAPSRKKEPNGPRRRAKVANRCRGVNWGWRVPGGSRGSQKGPRGSQRVPKGDPKAPKRGPKRFHTGFQRFPKGARKGPQRVPEGIPKGPKRDPKGSQRDP